MEKNPQIQKETDFIIFPLVNPSFDREEIDFDRIQQLASCGLDGYPPEDRCYAWLALLRIYPKNPLLWREKQNEIKTNYFTFVNFFQVETWETKYFPNQCPNIEIFGLGDNNSVMSIIHGDLVRTGRTIFFLDPLQIEGVEPAPADQAIFPWSGHIRRLERILYTFAIANKGLGYMQGFNELVVPFYWTLTKASVIFQGDLDLIEALSFEFFKTLLNETTLNEFYTTKDNSSIILHRLQDFTQLLHYHFPEAETIITSLNIHPLLYCFRWFNLLFSQEYDLPDLVLIWDSLMAHFDHLMDYVFYIGLGHIGVIKDKFDPSNASNTLGVLQNMPVSSPKEPLEIANALWNKDHKTSKFHLFKKKKFTK